MRPVLERRDSEYVLLDSERIEAKEKQPEKKPERTPEMKSVPKADNSSAKETSKETSRLLKTQGSNFNTFNAATSTIVVKQRSVSAPVTPIKTALPASEIELQISTVTEKKESVQTQLNQALVKNVKAGNYLEVRALIQRGANPLHRQARGQSVIAMAAKAGKSAVMEELISALSEPESKKGKSAYHERQKNEAQLFAVTGKSSVLDSKQEWKRAHEFVEEKYGRKIKPEGLDSLQNAVKHAIKFNHVHTLKVLMAHGLGRKIYFGDRETRPLMLAVKRGNLQIVKLLIAYGVDLNKADHNGDTALMIAARNDADNIFEELKRHGANSSIKNKAGESVAMILLERAEARLDELIKNTASKPAQRHPQKGREADSE